MKRWLPLVLVVLFVQSAAGQWLPSTPSGFDRGRPSYHKHARALWMSLEIPNWPFPNVSITQSQDEDQTEPSVAIDPRDPNTIIVGANDDRSFNTLWVYTSHDGGSTWKDRPLPTGPDWTTIPTDPSLSFTRTGVAYYLLGHISYPQILNDVALYGSTDRGDSWQMAGRPFINENPAKSDTSSDKYYLAVDAFESSPFHDRIYATWVEDAFPDRPRIVASYSADSGKSWSKRTFLSPKGYYSSPVTAVSPDGTLLIAYINYELDSNLIYTTASTDGGTSFSTPSLVDSYRNLGPWRGDTLNMNGYPVVKDTVGVNSFPSIAISPNYPYLAYAVWCGKDQAGISHLFMSKSTDKGKVWWAPRIIDGDSSGHSSDKFFPWIAIDSTTGNIAVVFYDSRLDSNNIATDLWMAHSIDTGKTFQVRRISNASFDPRTGRDERVPDDEHHIQFFGDYIGLAGRDNTWHPAWTDSRIAGDLEIYTATVQPYAPMPVEDPCARDTVIGGKHAQIIRWSYTPQTTFGYGLPKSYYVIVDKGGPADTIRNGVNFDLDTTADTLKNYTVSVVAGRYKSIPVTAARCDRSFVSEGVSEQISVLFSQQPAFIGKVQTVTINAEQSCSLSFAIYDELGRQLERVQDNVLSPEHTLRFTPLHSGAAYYIVRGMTASGVWQRSGRFLTLPGE